ncbi:hypothetical protein C0581_01905 [Candidatus Parcubacteria bacterium]|nr:MAG: hypothetical protein C0581_01905 [Candidatus Parcubacteria bacterium]
MKSPALNKIGKYAIKNRKPTSLTAISGRRNRMPHWENVSRIFVVVAEDIDLMPTLAGELKPIFDQHDRIVVFASEDDVQSEACAAVLCTALEATRGTVKYTHFANLTETVVPYARTCLSMSVEAIHAEVVIATCPLTKAQSVPEFFVSLREADNIPNLDELKPGEAVIMIDNGSINHWVVRPGAEAA